MFLHFHEEQTQALWKPLLFHSADTLRIPDASGYGTNPHDDYEPALLPDNAEHYLDGDTEGGVVAVQHACKHGQGGNWQCLVRLFGPSP